MRKKGTLFVLISAVCSILIAAKAETQVHVAKSDTQERIEGAAKVLRLEGHVVRIDGEFYIREDSGVELKLTGITAEMAPILNREANETARESTLIGIQNQGDFKLVGIEAVANLSDYIDCAGELGRVAENTLVYGISRPSSEIVPIAPGNYQGKNGLFLFHKTGVEFAPLEKLETPGALITIKGVDEKTYLLYCTDDKKCVEAEERHLTEDRFPVEKRTVSARKVPTYLAISTLQSELKAVAKWMSAGTEAANARYYINTEMSISEDKFKKRSEKLRDCLKLTGDIPEMQTAVNTVLRVAEKVFPEEHKKREEEKRMRRK